MTEPSADDDVRWVIDHERQLLEPAVRRSAERVERLLHPDFFEFGASGRRWDRQTTIAAIGSELTDGAAPAVSTMEGVRLADTVVLVTYTTTRPGWRARRTSVWRKGDNGTWRLYFHQATVIPPH
jgi:hypothetical protein